MRLSHRDPIQLGPTPYELFQEVLSIHATPGGQIERISELITRLHIPRREIDSRSQER